jgi:hypothetical protein
MDISVIVRIIRLNDAEYQFINSNIKIPPLVHMLKPRIKPMMLVTPTTFPLRFLKLVCWSMMAVVMDSVKVNCVSSPRQMRMLKNRKDHN